MTRNQRAVVLGLLVAVGSFGTIMLWLLAAPVYARFGFMGFVVLAAIAFLFGATFFDAEQRLTKQ